MCRIEGSAEVIGNGHYTPVSVARFRCIEHEMPVQGPCTMDTLCPIGRIERARDKALTEIAEAQRIHWVDAVAVVGAEIKTR